MRDLSLHVLDLLENSIRAGASVIEITVAQDPAAGTLRIAVEDDGPGIRVPVEVATDPFYTTKSGKKTGLGLSLFRGAAERAGGRLTVGRSRLGGAAIEATMELDNVDRSPLGDLAGAVSSIVCTDPEVDLRCTLSVGDRSCRVCVSELADGDAPRGLRGLAVARRVSEQIKRALGDLAMRE